MTDKTTQEAAQYLSERLSRTYTGNAVRQIARRGKWFPNARNTQPHSPRGVWLIPQEDLDAYIKYKRTRRPRGRKEERDV